MAEELRKTGISVGGDVPWGAHFCYFYETKQDLLDILVPYFKTGLENHEFCLWVISNSELLTVQEATTALRHALPDLDRYVADRSIEVVGHDDWFLSGKTFDPHKVVNRFKKKLNEALARGYAGMRVNGSPAWLRDAGQKELRKFEAELDKLFPNERTIASCTYPLAAIGAEEIFDVVRTHQFAIARRQGEWEIIETPELIEAKAEINRLNEELEQRVIERTSDLRVANEELRKEITERKQAEDELRRQKEILEQIFDHIPVMINFVDAAGRIKLVNREWERTLGWSPEEIRQQNVDVFAECYPDPQYRQQVLKFVAEAKGEWADFKTRVRDGRVMDTTWIRVHLSDGTSIGIGKDITERKREEEKLKQSKRQLAEAQRLAHVGSWDWDLRSNTVTWSDELYRIFGLQPGEIEVAGDAMPFIHPEDRALVSSTVESAVKNKEPYSFYYRVLRPGRDERILHSRGYILSDEAGAPIRVFGATQDVTELKRAEEELKASSEQLRALSASVQSAREEEAARIAREIHDELGSALTSLKLDLELIRRDEFPSTSDSELSRFREKIKAMMQLIDQTVDAVRRISSELRPSVLDDIGLVAAIRWQAQQFEAQSGIACHYNLRLEDVDLGPQQSTAIFRVFQEALTNVLRHAQATRVDITLEKEDDELVLTIGDNGRGITAGEKSDRLSLGLLGMQERVNLIGGTIQITGVEGKGTVITVEGVIPGKL